MRFNKYKFRFIIFCCNILIVTAIFGQPINNGNGDVTLPTADASSFGKFSEIPVSHFNGTPSISVPISTVQQGPLSLPITMNYNASGVKVAEVASWVGLGWTLNASAMVSRTVVGIPDEGINGWFDTNLTVGAMIPGLVAAGSVDSEPDLFNFSVAGYSGKFVFPMNAGTDPDVEAFIIPKQDIKITRIISSTLFSGIKIVTPDGVSYYFGVGSEGSFSETTQVMPNGDADVTGWYLAKIESHDQKHQIHFDYDEQHYAYYAPASGEHYSTISASNCGTQNNSGTRYLGPQGAAFSVTQAKGWRLTSVFNSSGTQSVDFMPSGTPRTDISSIGSHAPQSLSSIEINNGSYNKKFDLEYTYWQSLADNNDIASGTTASHWYKRLRLESIHEKPISGTETTSPYEFFYHGGINSLPQRLSRAIDHWGFFNGKSTNGTGNNNINVPPTIVGNISYGNADRNSSETHMLNGVLNKVIYPTKGYTEYEYGANRYLYPISQTSQLSQIDKVTTCIGLSECCDLHQFTGATFTMTADDFTYGQIRVQLSNGMGSCATAGWRTISYEVHSVANGFLFSNTITNYLGDPDMDNYYNLSTQHPTWNTPGDYFIKLITVNGFGAVTIFGPEASEEDVGGLRVEHITTYDRDSQIKNESLYEYTEDNSTESSGSLYSVPVYGSEVEDPGNFYLTSFRDFPEIPLGSFDGYHIGYNRVVEIKPSNGNTEYNFTTEPRVPNTTYPQIPDLYLAKHGRVDDIKVYREGASTPIQQSENAYLGSGYANFPYSPRKVFYTAVASGSSFCEYSILQPYSIRNGYNLLQSNAQTLDGLTTNTSHNYNTANQLMPTETTIINSDGTAHSTSYEYASTYQGNVGDKLREQNRLVPAWKTINNVGGNDVDGSQTTYSFFDTAGNPTASVTDQLYPYNIKRYEATYLNGAYQAGSWNDQYTIDKYQVGGTADVGMPSEISTFGWNDPIELTWDAANNMTLWKFKDFEKNYTYYNTNNMQSNLVETFEDIDGIKKHYQYDGLIRVNEIKDRYTTPQEVTTDITYNYGTQNTININTNYGAYNTELEKVIDGLGREIEIIQKDHGNGGVGDVSSTISYDDLGRKLSETDPRNLTTTYTYYTSPLNRIETVSNSANLASQTFTYSSGSAPISGKTDLRIQSVTDQDQRITTSYTDKIGRLVQRATGEAGNMAHTVTDYDGKNRVEKIHPPDGFNVASLMYEYSYDGDDNMITKKVPDKGMINYEYDDRNLGIAMNDLNIIAEGKVWLSTMLDDYGRAEQVGFGSSPGAVAEKLIENFYDGTGTSNTADKIYKGKIDKKIVNILDGFDRGGTDLTTEYTLDQVGRVANENIPMNHMSKEVDIDYQYDNADNILSIEKDVDGIISNTVNTYDGEGRLLTTTFDANGSTPEVITNITTYSNADDMLEKIVGGVETCTFAYNGLGWLTDINPSNIPSGSSMITACPPPDPTPTSNRLFSMNLSYTGGATPEYSGNISRQSWKVHDRDAMASDYIYDQLARITSSVTTSDIYNTSYTYADSRGNIETITREGLVSDGTCFEEETIDDLTIQYESNTNKISSITDAAMSGDECPDHYHVGGPVTQSGIWAANIELTSDALVEGHTQSTMQAEQEVELQAGFEFSSDGTGTFLAHTDDCANAIPNLASGGGSAAGFTGNGGTYLYDANGNMTEDPNKGFTFKYNHLNLIYEAEKDANNKIEWWYTAEGEKLKKTVTDENLAAASVQDYVGEYEYTDGNIEAIYHSEGRISASNNNEAQYFLKDHLGNTRVVFKKVGNQKEIIQESHYYPFGMALSGPWFEAPDVKNDYLYNGKELNKDLGLNLSDYGARFYDPAIGRFTSIDPKADSPNLLPYSPYHYTYNNPILYIDPNGETPIKGGIKIIKVGSKFFKKWNKARKSKKKFNAREAFDETIAEEIADIVNDAQTLTDGELTVDDIAAVIDMLVDTDLNKKKPKYSKKKARQDAKDKRDQQPASEDYVKYKDNKLDKAKGKDAGRRAHDKKEAGAPDRTKKQIDEDYDPNNN